MGKLLEHLFKTGGNVRLSSDVLVKCVGWEKQDYYEEQMIKAILSGKDFIMIPKSDYDEAMRVLENRRKQDEFLSQTAARNNEGIEFEKAGEADKAIAVYEENIAGGYPAEHAYKRLMVLYRRRKDYNNEIRVIKRAIEVFEQENNRRAEKAAREEPQLKGQIAAAVITCQQVMGSHGFYCFVPYDVAAYRERLAKAERLLEKQKGEKK